MQISRAGLELVSTRSFSILHRNETLLPKNER